MKALILSFAVAALALPGAPAWARSGTAQNHTCKDGTVQLAVSAKEACKDHGGNTRAAPADPAPPK